MATVTKIQWCDHTFNPWIGCSKVHAGCTNCYAEADMDKRRHRVKWGPGGTRSRTSAAYWRQPKVWNDDAMAWALHVALCQKAGITDYVGEWRAQDEGRDPPVDHRPRVFCASLADVLEDWEGPIVDHDGDRLAVDAINLQGINRYRAGRPNGQGQRWATMNDLRKDLFWVIDNTPFLDWLLLTKRPENIRRMWRQCTNCCNKDREADCSQEYRPQCSRCRGTALYRPNVWLGTSVSNQETADRQIPELLKCRDLSPVLFLSCEPLLGPINLDQWLYRFKSRISGLRYRTADAAGDHDAAPGIDWVIVGGESGPNARPSKFHWYQDIIGQCREVQVPVFMKQFGSKPQFGDMPMASCVTGWPWRDKKGGDPEEWPGNMRVRELPTAGEPEA